MKSFSVIAPVLLLLLALFVPTVVGAQEPEQLTVNDVASELYCPLCAGLTVDVCELDVCDEMRIIIEEKLAAGEDAEQIQAYFIEQYGQSVMGKPSTEGFHITAWVMPFIALIAAIAIFVLWLRSRPGAGLPIAVPASPEPPPPPDAMTPSDYDAQLERELRRIE